MKQVLALVLLLPILLTTSITCEVASQTTPMDWWRQNYISYKVAEANMTHLGGGAGAKLKALYVYWDDNYLYLALETANTASWYVAYGFKLDIVPGGYNHTVFNKDSWERAITYNGSKYGIDYEIYFWWDQYKGIESACLDIWKNVTSYSRHDEGWIYKCDDALNNKFEFPGQYAYEGTPGDSGKGLQKLWVIIPWSSLNIKPPRWFYIHAVISGFPGSTSVDSIPYDPEVVYRWTGETQIYQNLLPIPEPGILVAILTVATALGLLLDPRRNKP